MNYLLAILTLVALSGCGNETRTSWEKAFPWTDGIEVPNDPQEPGTTRVVYPDKKPAMDFNTHAVSYEHGIHVNAYDIDENLVSHRWQRSDRLK